MWFRFTQAKMVSSVYRHSQRKLNGSLFTPEFPWSKEGEKSSIVSLQTSQVYTHGYIVLERVMVIQPCQALYLWIKNCRASKKQYIKYRLVIHACYSTLPSLVHHEHNTDWPVSSTLHSILNESCKRPWALNETRTRSWVLWFIRLSGHNLMWCQ